MMPEREGTHSASRPGRTRLPVVLAVSAAAALFIGANAHLVYVALASQPECVVHVRAGEAGPGAFGAAKSAC